MFSHPDYDGHEALLFTKDAASGLRALIAIHDTTLGSAFGGCRMYPYASEQHAMTDVLRLSRGMTYKAAFGVFEALRAAAEVCLGRSDLEGLRVAVQGLGNVGMPLCGYLSAAGRHWWSVTLPGTAARRPPPPTARPWRHPRKSTPSTSTC